MMAMSATVEMNVGQSSDGVAIFRPPYDCYDESELLRHFQRRRSVQFFSDPDLEETRSEKIDAILHNRFEFLGEAHRLPDPLQWTDNPSADIEWHILLHKFHYAVGLGMRFEETKRPRYLQKWIELTASWIAQTPPGFIAADVTGRRVQNWIYAYFHFVAQAQAKIPPEFHHRFLASLHGQVEYLCQNLHPARNHRTIELYSIYLAAVVFPEFTRSEEWLRFSLAEIMCNMESDLLADGVHCELSTDYHHLALKNYLCVRRLAKLNDIEVPPRMDGLLQKALEFSLYVHRPDGLIPSLSDGDTHSYLGLLLQGHELFGRKDMLYVATAGAQGTPPVKRSADFSDSGYFVVRSGWGDRGSDYVDERFLVFDCGPLGAGNHGHFDLLNIELYGFGKPLVVDPGRYTYHEDDEVNWRVRFRGTGYHNTVMVDGKDQTRYLPGPTKYRIKGEPPEYELRKSIHQPGFDYLHGVARSHEYDATHERRIAFALPDYWILCDTLSSPSLHQYELMFHLSEQAQDQVEIERDRGNYFVSVPNLVIAQCETATTLVTVGDGYVSKRYGDKEASPILRFVRQATDTVFHTLLYPYKNEAPNLFMRLLPVWSSGGTETNVIAICISIDHDNHVVTDYCFFAPHGQKRTWQFANYHYDGDYLFLRKNAYGQVTRLHTRSGATLTEAGYPVSIGAH